MPGLEPLPYNQGSWFTSDLHAYRPAATPANFGNLYWETDTNGGTLFHSDGYNWNQTTPGVTALVPTGLPGATAAIRFVGGTVSGHPTGGPWLVGDLSVDQSGEVWICTVAGSPGTWKSPVGFANPMTTLGDIVVGGASGAPTREGIGSTGQVLTVVSGSPAWATKGLLAVHAYAAGSDAAVTSTSTSFVDVDATNHAITFTAPASGNVLVRASGLFSSADALNNVFFGLRESTTDLANTSRLVLQSLSGGEYTPGTLAFYLTGVTGGSHTYKLSFKTSNASTAVEVSTGPTYGQTIYEVWAN